ncbi:MAG: lipid II flippase MurJ, partial [Candidatus Hadarchaeum sp.]
DRVEVALHGAARWHRDSSVRLRGVATNPHPQCSTVAGHGVESFLQSLTSAVIWKGLDRLAGLAKHIVVAASVGLAAQLDVFYMAVALLGVLVFSWGQMVDVVAVPRLVQEWRDGRQQVFRDIAAGLFSLTLLGSILLGAFLLIAWPWLRYAAAGFDDARSSLLVEAIVWLLPVVVLHIPFRLMGAVLRAQRRFAAFYQGEFMIAAVVLALVMIFPNHDHVLLWSFSAGTLIAFFFLMVQARPWIWPLGSPWSDVVRQSLHLAPGLLILQGAHYAYVLTDRLFVSYLPTGAVSALAYAMTIVSILPSLLSPSGSFITVIAEQKDRGERSRKLNDLVSLTVLASAGMVAFIVLAGSSLVSLLLERGMFTAADTQHVFEAMLGYAWLLPPLLLIGPLDQVFQVEQRIEFMVRRTLLGLAINAILTAWFLFGLDWGVFGVALATSISYWLMLLSGLDGLRRLGYSLQVWQHAGWIVWLVLCVGGAAVAMHAWMPMAWRFGAWPIVWSGIGCGLAMLAAGVVYPGSQRVLVIGTLKRCIPRFRR